MKKRFLGIAIFALAMCLGAFALTGCGGGDEAATDDAAAAADDAAATADAGDMLGEDGIFAVGFDQDFPPYGYVDEETGDFKGFDLDLATEVANRNGWEIKLVPISWDAKDLELESGTIDCIWNGFTIEGREDGYTWTDAYMDNSQVVVTRADSGIESLADLEGKTVMAQADSAALALFEEDGDQYDLGQTFANLQTTPEYNTAFMELESGAVDAVAIDAPVAAFNTQGKEDVFKILDEQLSTEHYGVGFKLGNEALRDAVQATLLEMVADGTVAQVAEGYADQGISMDAWCLAAE